MNTNGQLISHLANLTNNSRLNRAIDDVQTYSHAISRMMSREPKSPTQIAKRDAEIKRYAEKIQDAQKIITEYNMKARSSIVNFHAEKPYLKSNS